MLHIKQIIRIKIRKKTLTNSIYIYFKRLNFSSKVMPVGLDFVDAKNIALVAIETSKISEKITYIKNYQSLIHSTTIAAIFIPSFQ